MDNNNVDRDELLEKLVKNSEKQLFYTRITTLAALALVVVVAGCLAIVIPKVMETVENANNIIEQASGTISEVSETIKLADTALESVTEMSESITQMGTNMDTFIAENAETLEAVMKKFNAVDFEGLNKAIKDLGDVVEPLANFFGNF